MILKSRKHAFTSERNKHMKMEELYGSNLIKNIEAGSLCGIRPQIEVNKADEDLYHLSFVYELQESGEQEDLNVCIQLPQNPDFAWSPHLTPEEGYIIQQHVYRTPAMIFGYEKTPGTVIVFPDLEALKDHSGFWYMDMDAQAGTMYVGLSDSMMPEHVLYQKSGTVSYEAGKTVISFYVLISDTIMENPFRPVLDFYWSRYGRQDALDVTPAKKDPDGYIAHTYDWVFDRWKDVMWQEFELDGKKVGAPVFIVNVTQSPNYPGHVNERELRSIWNQAWFCSLRSASGLYRYAKRTGREDLLNYANMTKELALSFPQTDGLFDAVIATDMEKVQIDGKDYSRSLGWGTKFFGNSDRNPYGQPVKTAPKHILDMSFTAEYMLVWYEELEKDERLLTYAVNFGERLLTLQDEQGYFPGWVSDEGTALGILDQGPESAMAAVFLMHLAKITGEKKYEAAALKAIAVLMQEVIPCGRWEDFETYWSCCRFWEKRVGKKIARNNMYKQCNFSMFWTAWALFEAYQLTKENKYLQVGQKVLDELLMTQSSYQPYGMSVPVVGGFGVMNADAELDDARQSLFAELIVRYGNELDMQEYIERGKAAMRMSFSMMYCPENPETKAQWEKTWPFFNERDYGFMMENYGHSGKTDNEGLGIGEFTIYDWGNGAASECCERMRAHFGEEILKA